MASKRMFTNKITDDDNFISMASSTQLLYFHLNQGADDDGFNNQVQMAMWKAHASIDDLKVLMAKNYIIRFESGVIVIKHWRMHNTLRKDRYTPTSFQEELKQLGIKTNGAYTLDDTQAVEEWLPNGCQMVATDKNSIDKNSIDKSSIDTPQKRFCKPTIEEVQAYCDERNNGVDAQKWFDYYEANGWKVGRNAMKDWKASVRTWERSDTKDEKHKGKSVRTIDYGKYTDEL